MSAFPPPLDTWATHQALIASSASFDPASPANLPSPQPTRSFWTHSDTDANPLASEGSTGALTPDADVCIIGSGITGVGVAYHLAQLLPEGKDPLKVVIVEARDFCSGATGRNGGHLTPAAFLDFATRAREYGTAEAVRSYALEEHTAASLVSITEAHGLSSNVDLVEGGHISLLLTDLEVKEAREDYEAAEGHLDLTRVEWVDKETMQRNYGTPYPAVRSPGHNVWPLKLVTELYRLAKAQPQKLSLALHTRTPVTSITSTPDASGPHKYVVSTPRGPIACTRIIHATNAYASHLLPFLTGTAGIIPTRGQVMAVRAGVGATEITKSGWGGNQGLEYWFPRPVKNPSEHPLIILGGGREAAVEHPFELYVDDDSVVNPAAGKVLRDFLPGIFPGKFEPGREPEMEWTGIMAFTLMGDPFVGPVIDPSDNASEKYKGQYIAAGYTGHGMPRAFGCAEVVAQMIAAELAGEIWSRPAWLPERYLTWNRLGK
ncbi:FAD dependent oxidoreductase [Leucogyrophana mollusca]|uniref:FAD dependent oxidoreductase n=1 Tax=Leucogyrophana mollusca TaxID=85980 RepID=A0ACB8BFR9_9AGAM|nr:FAD dependent oxidoreductase [Leucogyrophana mollusca]